MTEATPISTNATHPLFEHYRPSAIHDECRDADGRLRPAWAKIAPAFERLGEWGVAKRWAECQRLLRDNGVTYNIVGDSDSERPWLLDGIPAVLSQTEWHTVERGVIQRAQLLEAILGDCYDQRELLQDSSLPPAAVFGHPGYLRPCLTVPPAGGHYLHFLAIDLLRTPDGNWVVTNHRTQAPTGFGYCLENRVVGDPSTHPFP